MIVLECHRRYCGSVALIYYMYSEMARKDSLEENGK